MKKITKLFIGVFCALLLATSAFAADTNAASTSLYNAQEFGLSIGSGYGLGPAGSIKDVSVFGKPYGLNFNAGAFYFPWRNVGIEANVPFYQSKGVSLDEVQAGLLFRLPLAKETPLFKNISPYVGVGGVYNWQTAQDWAYIAKVGTEVRLNKKWGLFVEGQYRNFEVQNFNQGAVSLNGGLHLVF